MSGRGGQEGGYLEDVGGFLTGDFEDRVILDTMDDLGGTRGSYPEGFVSLSLFLEEIYKFVVLVNKSETHYRGERKLFFAIRNFFLLQIQSGTSQGKSSQVIINGQD